MKGGWTCVFSTLILGLWATGYAQSTLLDDLAVITTENAAQLQQLIILDRRDHPIFDLAFSPNGQTLASGYFDGSVVLWDLQTQTEQLVLSGQDGWIETVTFSHDGKVIASGGSAPPWESSIRLWDAQTGELIAQYPEPDPARQAGQNWVSDLAFSSDDSLLANSANPGPHTAYVRLRSLSTDEMLLSQGNNGGAVSLAFSPNGALLATGGWYRPDGGYFPIRLWNLETVSWEEELVDSDGAVEALEFTRTGELLAAASGSIQLWDMVTREPTLDLRGHRGDVETISFNLDDTLLASGGDDHTIRLWDVQLGTEIAVLQQHTDDVMDVEFSPDGTLLASASRDGTIRLWGVAQG